MYEISSDSDDDCYNKFSQKLQKLKNKLYNPLRSNDFKVNSADNNDVLIVDLLTELDGDVNPVLNEINDPVSTVLTPIELPNTSVHEMCMRSTTSNRKNSDVQLLTETPPRKRGKRGRGRGRAKQTSISSPQHTQHTSGQGGRTRRQASVSSPQHTQHTIRQSGRTRGQASVSSPQHNRGRGGRRTRSRNITDCETITLSTPSPTTHRGRKRNRQQITSNLQSIVYSVGNTDDYPDFSDHQALFSKKKSPIEEANADILDIDESLDNEELSVKVYWQHSEVFKFNIRRLQKLTQIFDFFVNKEEVSRDHLLFTYSGLKCNKILCPNDTPESIDYNIANFIEGGVVNKQFRLDRDKSPIENLQKNGFTLKFQCQIKKKPLELLVGKDEKLQKAMVRCAEELEIPIARLFFEFDGEIVYGNATPNEMDMESGDCIDVKIVK